MKNLTTLRLLGVRLAALTLSAASALAQVPLTFNTGVDDSGAVLADYSVDPHFALLSSSDGRFPGPAAQVVDGTLFPLVTGNWLANSSVSKWIAPQANQDYLLAADNGNAPGNYTYRTTFDLTGYDPELVQLVGQWTCDSVGIDVLINGLSTGNATITNLYADAQWNPLLITTGFVPGTNTLDFVINRAPMGATPNLPTGLRAEFTITNLPPPQLSIGIDNRQVLVWWPTNTPAFALETSPALGMNPNWSRYAGPVIIIGNQNLVVAEAAGPALFFRLHRP